MTSGEKRAASVLRQGLMLALVELAADIGTASVERIHAHRAELALLRDELNRIRTRHYDHAISHDGH